MCMPNFNTLPRFEGKYGRHWLFSISKSTETLIFPLLLTQEASFAQKGTNSFWNFTLFAPSIQIWALLNFDPKPSPFRNIKSAVKLSL